MTAFADDAVVPHLTQQTDRLLASVRALDDAAVRAPSALPGWTRGHVLTHLARNADGFANVLTSAVTGTVTPMYLSPEQRDADIEAGAGRSASVQEADVEASAERLLALLAAVPEDGLDLEVPTGRGPLVRVREVPWLRLREVFYHHVDLACGFTFADVPDPLVRAGLDEAASRLAGAAPGVSAAYTHPDGTTSEVVVGDGAVSVAAPAHALLAWLTGRSSGEGVEPQADSALPSLPSWG